MGYPHSQDGGNALNQAATQEHPEQSNTGTIPPSHLFLTRRELPVSLQVADAEQRIGQLESQLWKSQKATSHWQHIAQEERLRLRVALQEQREWIDLERHRLEKLAEVARLPWWRFGRKRAILQELKEDMSAAGQG